MRTYTIQHRHGTDFPFVSSLYLNDRHIDSSAWATRELAENHGKDWVESDPDYGVGDPDEYSDDIPEADDPVYDADLSHLFDNGTEDELVDLAEVACMVRRYRDETSLFDGE